MKWQDHIECSPEVMVGKAVFKGTRIPVEDVLRKLAAEVPEAQILEAYPRLTHEHITAAIAYAADVVASDQIQVLKQLT